MLVFITLLNFQPYEMESRDDRPLPPRRVLRSESPSRTDRDRGPEPYPRRGFISRQGRVCPLRFPPSRGGGGGGGAGRARAIRRGMGRRVEAPGRERPRRGR